MSDTQPLPYVWTQLPSSVFCALKGLQGVDDQYEIKRGISRAQGFPDDAYFDMDPRYKKQVKVPDGVWNLDRMAVISPKLKAAIEAFEPRNVELLPVEIRDHKGKPVKEPYHILNPIGVVDCLDKTQSQLNWNLIDPELIADVLKLVLRPEALDPNLAFFRVKHMPQYTFVRADVAEKLMAQKFTGFTFTPADEFVS